MKYIFGVYTLDTECYELRSAEGVIPLERQGFTMLVYLIQHRDRVVLRQELFDHLWPNHFVSDASLEQCIAVVRRAVKDSGRAQRVIQTVRGRGYRFVAPITAMPCSESRQRAQVDQPQGSPDRPFHPESLVGREWELSQLQQWYATAGQGHRQS